MPTLPDNVGAREGAGQLRRRWGRRQAIEVRRGQEFVFRIWFGAMVCTALPLALASSQALPFPTWALWAIALSVMAVVCLFAAASTRQNTRLLALALEAQGASEERRPRVHRSSPWRVPSVRTLTYASRLFVALAATYGTIATLVVVQTRWPEAPLWLPLAAALPLLALGAALGRSSYEPALLLAGAEESPAGATLRTAVPTVSTAGSAVGSTGSDATDGDRDAIAAPPTLASSSHTASAAHASVSPLGAAAPTAAAGLASRAPSKPANSRPSLELDDVLTPTPRRLAQQRAAGSPEAALGQGWVSMHAGSDRPSSLGEAISSLFPDGASLIPALLTPIPPRSQPSVAVTPSHAAASVERLSSGVQELRKQSLTEPKRTRREVDRAVTSNRDAAAASCDAQERDTERPPSRRTDRVAKPLFRESEIPTTPAPAEASSDPTAASPPPPPSFDDEYTVRIPRSPKAPVFSTELLAETPTDPERREASPENFRPTQPAIPSARQGLQAPSEEAISRPTRPAAEREIEEATRAELEAAVSGEHDVRTRSPALPPPPPSDATAEPVEPNATTPHNQFEVAYNGRGGPGYAEHAEAEGVRPTTAESPATGLESSVPPVPADSEIRCVEVGERQPPTSVLERELLSALRQGRPSDEDFETRPSPDVDPVTIRKRALH